MFEHSWSVPPQVDVDGHSPSQVLILHIVDSFLRLPAVAVPERLHYKRRIYNSRRLCHETLVMDVATQQRTLPNIVQHWQQNITKHCRTLPCLADYVMRRWLWMSRRRSGGRLEFQVIQVAPWFGEATFGGNGWCGLEQAQQQQ